MVIARLHSFQSFTTVFNATLYDTFNIFKCFSELECRLKYFMIKINKLRVILTGLIKPKGWRKQNNIDSILTRKSIHVHSFIESTYPPRSFKLCLNSQVAATLNQWDWWGRWPSLIPCKWGSTRNIGKLQNMNELYFKLYRNILINDDK